MQTAEVIYVKHLRNIVMQMIYACRKESTMACTPVWWQSGELEAIITYRMTHHLRFPADATGRNLRDYVDTLDVYRCHKTIACLTGVLVTDESDIDLDP
jgi:hypothetical protein